MKNERLAGLSLFNIRGSPPPYRLLFFSCLSEGDEGEEMQVVGFDEEQAENANVLDV